MIGGASLEKYNNLVEVIQNAAQTNNGIRFIEGQHIDQYIPYVELYERSLRLLHSLQSHGIEPGDELVFQFNDNCKFIETFIACLLGGIVAVPIHLVHTKNERKKLQNVWQILKNPKIITESPYINEIAMTLSLQPTIILNYEYLSREMQRGIIYKVEADDIAYIQFSSGSTGAPKGCILTHHNLITNIQDMITASHITTADQTFSWMPLTHDLGLIGFFLTPLYLNITLNIMSTALFIRRPMLWMQKISEYRVTITASPNFGYRFFMKRMKVGKIFDWDLSCVRLIFNGAEPISLTTILRFINSLKPYNLKENTMYPVYGMAEACLGIAFPKPGSYIQFGYYNREQLAIGQSVQICQSSDEKAIALIYEGYPLDSLALKICDDKQVEVGEGIVGHILIKGNNVTKGYYQNPKATEKALTGDLWLKTGDLGFKIDGKVVVVGRSKDVVIVNGQKFHSHDLENQIGEAIDIDSEKIIIVSINISNDYEQIIAFIQYHPDKLLEFLNIVELVQKTTMEHFGFSFDAVFPIRKIPKTTSTKKQRFLVKEQYQLGQFDEIQEELQSLMINECKGQERAVSELEKTLLVCWETILETTNVGVEDHFFEVGGDSLKATQLAIEIECQMGLDAPLSLIYSHPTIRAQATQLQKQPKASVCTIPIENKQPYYPLSPSQKRIYIRSKFKDSDTAFNVPVAIQLDGNMNIQKFESAINKLITRHSILRTSFFEIDGIPYQKIHGQLDYQLETGSITLNEIEHTIQSFIRSFELQKPGLFRIGLYRIEETTHLLILDMHHLISDGTSISLIMEELDALYAGEVLEPLEIQYKDYALWKDQTSNISEEELVFWKKNMRKTKKLNLPLDFPKMLENRFEGNRVFFEIPPKLVDGLQEIAHQYDVTPYMVLCSAYQVFLYHYSGQNDIVSVAPFAGRKIYELQKMIGPLLNVVPICSQLEEEMTFKAVLEQMKSFLIGAYACQDFPFERLYDEPEIANEILSFIFQANMFVFQNFKKPTFNKWEYKILDISNQTAQYDLLLSITTNRKQMSAFFEYSKAAYKEETVLRFIDSFHEILNQLVSNPLLPLNEILVSELQVEDKIEILSFEF